MDEKIQKIMAKSTYLSNLISRIPPEMLSFFFEMIQFDISDKYGEVIRLKMRQNGQYMNFVSPMTGIDIQEYYMGGMDALPGHSKVRALENTMVIHYCNRGRAEIRVNDGKYAYMKPGTLCIEWHQEAGKSFNFYDDIYGGLEIVICVDNISSEDEAFLGRVGIDAESIRKACEQNGQYYIGECQDRLRHAFDDLRDIIENGDKDKNSYLINMLYVLDLIRTDDIAVRDTQFYLTKGQRRIVQEIYDTIRQDLSRDVSMAELESLYGMSSVSINKYFEIVYGDTVKRYMQSKRMAYAAKQLTGSNISVADIALSVGYESQSKFGTVFKCEYGCTPLEYRRLGGETT